MLGGGTRKIYLRQETKFEAAFVREDLIDVFAEKKWTQILRQRFMGWDFNGEKYHSECNTRQ